MSFRTCIRGDYLVSGTLAFVLRFCAGVYDKLILSMALSGQADQPMFCKIAKFRSYTFAKEDMVVCFREVDVCEVLPLCMRM